MPDEFSDFLRKVKEVAAKPREQWSWDDETIKHQASIIAVTNTNRYRGETEIHEPGQPWPATGDVYQRAIAEGWKHVTNSDVKTFTSEYDKQKIKNEFISQLPDPNKQKAYDAALGALEKRLRL